MRGAYYNEYDPDAAAWLRELVRRGLIADGEVDERSILDVDADDVRGFCQCHWFAGIGGWSYALRLAGWPDNSPVWTGSPPCQPFSVAGKQKGRDDARHLAPKFISLVGAARPGMLFGEQVASADVFGKAAKRAGGNFVAPPQWSWLDDLSDRLEAARYAVGASDFPSAGVGAPHIRQRTFFGAVSHEWLADADGGERQRIADGKGCQRDRAQAGRVEGDGQLAASGEFRRLADAEGDRRADGSSQQRSGRQVLAAAAEIVGIGDRRASGGLVHSIGAGLEGHGGHGDGIREPGRLDPHALGSVAAAGADGGMADSSSFGRDRGQGASSGREHVGADAGWSEGNDGPVRIGETGYGSRGTSPLHGFWRDADWLFCRDGKWRPVEPAVLGMVDGIPGCVVPSGPFVPASYPLAQGGRDARRAQRLRGYGNAINPHAAAEFIRAFAQVFREVTHG